MNWQSYQFVGCWVLVLFALVAKPSVVKNIPLKKAAVALGMVALMAIPNVILLLDGKNLIFPLRMFPQDFRERLMVEAGIIPSELDPSYVPIGILPKVTQTFTAM